MEVDSKYSKLYFENPMKHFEDNYNNISSPVSHLAPKKVYDFYHKRIPMIKIKKNFEASEG
jgi:hypothetical protein